MSFVVDHECVNWTVTQARSPGGSGRDWRQQCGDVHVEAAWDCGSAKDDHRDADLHQREMRGRTEEGFAGLSAAAGFSRGRNFFHFLILAVSDSRH